MKKLENKFGKQRKQLQHSIPSKRKESTDDIINRLISGSGKIM